MLRFKGGYRINLMTKTKLDQMIRLRNDCELRATLGFKKRTAYGLAGLFSTSSSTVIKRLTAAIMPNLFRLALICRVQLQKS